MGWRGRYDYFFFFFTRDSNTGFLELLHRFARALQATGQPSCGEVTLDHCLAGMWCRFPALVTAVTLCALCFLVVSADEDDSGSSDSNEAHEVMKEQLIVSPDNKEEDQDSDDEEATIFLGTSNDRSVPEMSCKSKQNQWS